MTALRFTIPLLTLLAASPAFAGEKRTDGFSMGIDVHRWQDDFGLSATVTTPAIADSVRITAAGGVNWYPYALADGSTWTTYGHTRVVVEGGMRMRDFPLRLYGFGGFTMLFAKSVGGATVTPGGIGGFGFEFSTQGESGDGQVSYVIELGGIGVGGNDRGLVFANGFVASAGFRFFP